MLRYATRPLSDRTWLRQFDNHREVSRFTALWSDTLDLLEREYEMVGGSQLVVEVDVPDRAIRNDGTLRADAKAQTPAVVVAFETKRAGPLLFRCDTYVRPTWGGGAKTDSWQHNVRAVAMTLQALRAVDRYGASKNAEQYRGYRAIGAGTGEPSSHMTSDEAWQVLRAAVGLVDGTTVELADLIRMARATSHPDRHGGARTAWDHVEQAVLTLTRPTVSHVRAVGQ